MNTKSIAISKIVCNITITMGLEVINERASFQIVKGPIPLNEAGGAFIQFKQFKIFDFNDNEITMENLSSNFLST